MPDVLLLRFSRANAPLVCVRSWNWVWKWAHHPTRKPHNHKVARLFGRFKGFSFTLTMIFATRWFNIYAWKALFAPLTRKMLTSTLMSFFKRHTPLRHASFNVIGGTQEFQNFTFKLCANHLFATIYQEIFQIPYISPPIYVLFSVFQRSLFKNQHDFT